MRSHNNVHNNYDAAATAADDNDADDCSGYCHDVQTSSADQRQYRQLSNSHAASPPRERQPCQYIHTYIHTCMHACIGSVKCTVLTVGMFVVRNIVWSVVNALDYCVLLTAHSSSRSTPSPVLPKHLVPLTPASARKNKNKLRPQQNADETSKQSALRTNQQREISVRSLSPAIGPVSGQRLRERSASPGATLLGHSSRAASPRTTSPAIVSLGQRSVTTGQRSHNTAAESGVFSRRSASLSKVQQTATTNAQQTSVLCFCIIVMTVVKYLQF